MKKRIKILISILLVAVVAACSFAFFAQGAEGTAGDANLDGKVTAADAMLVLRAASNLETLSAEQTVRADVTYDGTINSVDALRILMYVTGNASDLGDVGSEEGDELIM